VENLKSNDIKPVFISSLQSESDQTRDSTSQEDVIGRNKGYLKSARLIPHV
jgi:hypothetical protein